MIFRQPDNLFGHLTINENQGYIDKWGPAATQPDLKSTSRSPIQMRGFHGYKNSSSFNFEHSEKQIRNFRNEHTSRNILAGMSRTFTDFNTQNMLTLTKEQAELPKPAKLALNDFGGFGQIVPKKIREKDSTPGLRFFGMPSGYSPLRKTIDTDFDLSPHLTMKKRNPSAMTAILQHRF